MAFIEIFNAHSMEEAFHDLWYEKFFLQIEKFNVSNKLLETYLNY